ncbi:MAG: 50S ribosomal protein L22 [Acutalibacteraceae bacterium]
MEARAILRGVRISPMKVQIVLDLIRNQPADKAMAILHHTPKAACECLEKLLKSAMNNAVTNHHMDASSLYVKECHVGPGAHTLKRMRPMDHGKAFRILKRTSNITIVLGEKE